MPVDAAALWLCTLILDYCSQRQNSLTPTHVRANITLPLSEMQRVRFGQPDMSVNTCAFIKPSIAEAGVHAYHQIIFGAITRKVTDVEAEGRVAVVVAANEVAVQKNQGVAKCSIEFEPKPPPVIALRNIKSATVPTHAGLGILSPERLVPMALQIVIMNEWQLDGPVMRKIQRSPIRGVKLLRGKLELARLGEVTLVFAETEVARRIVGMTEAEFPSEIHEQAFARCNRRQVF